jgi:hypothetical protein
MADSLSFAPVIRVFSCPNCRETINTSMQQCAFCSTPIDPAAAELAGEATSKISQACSDASYLKIMLGTLVPFAVAILIPFLSFVGVLGFTFIKYATVVMCARWWFKFRDIKTTDPDFLRARKTAIIVSIASVLVVAVLHSHIFGLRL